MQVYHSVLNRSTYFCYKDLAAWCKLLAVAFNQGGTPEQAKTKNGDDRFNDVFRKDYENLVC